MHALHSTEAEHFLLKMSGKMLSSVNQGAVLKFKWMVSVFKYELQSKKGVRFSGDVGPRNTK